VEPHPVPQNILDVEFKLFGSFTLKQFGKILIGSLIGVGIFFINLNPIIKIPLVLASVFIGILSAIIPNFQVWLLGFIKALFISPRYVWVKETVTPEILTSPKTADVMKDRNVSSSLNKKKLDISELPLDKMFGTTTVKSSPANEEEFKNIEGQNLNRMYEDIFEGVKPTKPIAQKLATSQPPVAPIPTGGFTPRFRSLEEYQKEINKLKFELSSLTKNPNMRGKEQEIMDKINDLYNEIKHIQGAEAGMKADPRAVLKQNEMIDKADGKIVFGIVVDKTDKPIPAANVTFTNIATNQALVTATSADGKFNSSRQLPKGEYALTIEAPNKRFHSYKVVIGEMPLPAYKLREK
jgi:hypothetical protein